MKILLTSDWYEGVTNGLVTSQETLMAGLEALGHDVRLLTLSDRIRHPLRQGQSYYLPSMQMGFIYPQARLGLPRWPRVRRAIGAFGPDVIHSQSEFASFSLAHVCSKTFQVPHVHTLHTLYDHYSHYISPNPRLGRWTIHRFMQSRLNKVDALIAPTSKTYEQSLVYQISAPRIVVPTGLDLSRFQAPLPAADRYALRQGLGIAPDQLVALHVGRLGREKNLLKILEAFHALRNPQARLLLVGDGPYRKKLENRIRQLGLAKQIILTGQVAHKDVPCYYHAADLFLSASRSETQGLTFIEAMASGLPVLCYADPCLEGVLTHGVHGFQAQSDQDFQAHLQDLLDQPDLRHRLGQAGCQHATAHFSQEAFALKVLDVYQQSLASF